MTAQIHSLHSASVPHQHHLVLFYEDGAFPEITVADYLWEGLAAEECVITASSAANTRLLRTRLAALGADIEALEQSGRLIMFDGHALLDSFMADTLPNRERFFEVVGGAIDDAIAVSPTPACRAFGEMVRILVDDGNIDGAIQLERYWNDLLASRNCRLYCAYPMHQFAHASLAEPFLHICNAHGHVRPVPIGSHKHHDHDSHGRCMASLQQQARALQTDIAQRREVEAELKRHRDHLVVSQFGF